MLIALKIQSVTLIIFSSCISSSAPKCLIRLLACYPCFLYVCGMLPITLPNTKTRFISSFSIGSQAA